jgi:hypothetical protein
MIYYRMHEKEWAARIIEGGWGPFAYHITVTDKYARIVLGLFPFQWTWGQADVIEVNVIVSKEPA